jgi:hypothetical protein
MDNKTTYKKLRKRWNSLSVALKWSNKYFADAIYQKIRSAMPTPLAEDAAIGGYNNPAFFTEGWYEDVKHALKEAKGLAECEHNRWDVQQLLLGFTPADKTTCQYICTEQKKTAKQLSPLSKKKEKFIKDNTSYLKRLLEDIKNKFPANDLTENVDDLNFTELLAFIAEKNKKIKKEENQIVIDAEMSAQLQAMKECEEKINAINKPLTQYKKALKSPINKIHYCICDFDHLDAVDPGAKLYDQKLNNGIPLILKLVDGYHYKK